MMGTEQRPSVAFSHASPSLSICGAESGMCWASIESNTALLVASHHTPLSAQPMYLSRHEGHGA